MYTKYEKSIKNFLFFIIKLCLIVCSSVNSGPRSRSLAQRRDSLHATAMRPLVR